jgi:hypothetical protein
VYAPSAFVQDEIALVQDRISATLGAKFERNDFTGFELQPTARLAWTLSRQQTVWAAIARAVRTPTLFEDQRSVTQGPVSPAPGITVFPRIVANPDLASEEALAYELGYRVQPRAEFNVDAALFYSVYDGLKVFAPLGASTAGAPLGTRFQLSTQPVACREPHQRQEHDQIGADLAQVRNHRLRVVLYRPSPRFPTHMAVMPGARDSHREHRSFLRSSPTVARGPSQHLIDVHRA